MYALVFNNQVCEVCANQFPVHTGFSWESVPPNPDVQPGWQFKNGSFIAPAPTGVTLSQLATSALSATITIECNSNPALDGEYACGLHERSDILSEIVSLAEFGTFTSQSTTLAYYDINKTAHQFSVSEFKAFAAKLALYINQLKIVQNTNSGSLPSSTLVLQ